VVDLVAINREARDVLSMFLDPSRVAERPKLTAALRPGAADLDAAFQGETVPILREHFERLWAAAPILSPPADLTELSLAVATSDDILAGLARAFPGGYARVPLAPARAWVCWKYKRPGEPHGLAFDGLVHLGFRRFAWFPKPWKAFDKSPVRPADPYSE
jgi:hypothetical protein